MAVPVIASSTESSDSGTQTTVNMPATRPDGDIFIAIGVKDDSPDWTNVPAAWGAARSNTPHDAQTRLTVWAWKGSSEPASYTIDHDNEETEFTVLRITGGDADDIIEAQNGSGSPGSDTASAPDITPANGNTLLLRVFGCDRRTLSTFSEGTTEVNIASSGANGVSLAVTYIDGPSAGVGTGTATAVLAASDAWLTRSICINEAAPSDPTGNGDISAAAADVSGGGKSSSVGDGGLDSAAATIAGSGHDLGAANGNLAASAAAMAGSGLSKSIGDGDLASAAATAAGSGLSKSVGNGALAAAAAAIAGSGVVGASLGNGELEAAVSTLAGSGVSKSPGNGDLAAANSNISGSGSAATTGEHPVSILTRLGPSGYGVRRTGDFSDKAAGEAGISGNGDLAAAVSTLGGSGLSKSVGEGALDADAATLVGSGSRSLTPGEHPVGIITRLGEAGYGVRRLGNFSGKTSSEEPEAATGIAPFVYRRGRRLRASKRAA